MKPKNDGCGPRSKVDGQLDKLRKPRKPAPRSPKHRKLDDALRLLPEPKPAPGPVRAWARINNATGNIYYTSEDHQFMIFDMSEQNTEFWTSTPVLIVPADTLTVSREAVARLLARISKNPNSQVRRALRELGLTGGA